jgi:signal transduction histidine kinase
MDHVHHVEAPTESLDFFDSLMQYFSEQDFMPHGHCYLWKPGLMGAHVVSDILIGLAYISISIILYTLVKRIKIQFDRIVLSFGVFIGACGLTHFMEVWNLWYADYWWSAWVKVVTAIASVSTGIYLFKLRHTIVQVAEAAKLAEERRLDLESLTQDLENRVGERTKELTAAILTRDRFLSMASHELKTPLTSLKLHTQLQAKKMKQNPQIDFEYDKALKFLDMIDDQNKRLTRLVDDMLDVSRIQAGKLELNKSQVNICDVIEEFVERFRPHFEELENGLDFEGCESIMVELDVFRFDQVLNNIITNALKYASGRPVKVSIVREAAQVRVSIKDQGKGIAKENLDKIFQRFERATSENDPAGLGLGLYISREIIIAHGGNLWAESKIDVGSEFFITIPLSEVGN